jgi:hypothetical protein
MTRVSQCPISLRAEHRLQTKLHYAYSTIKQLGTEVMLEACLLKVHSSNLNDVTGSADGITDG